jgi:hypothetical protein
MVNERLILAPVELRDFCASIPGVWAILLLQIITASRSRSGVVNLFDCATPSSFCGLRGGAKDFSDDRDGYSSDGPGERGNFPGSCI